MRGLSIGYVGGFIMRSLKRFVANFCGLCTLILLLFSGNMINGCGVAGKRTRNHLYHAYPNQLFWIFLNFCEFELTNGLGKSFLGRIEDCQSSKSNSSCKMGWICFVLPFRQFSRIDWNIFKNAEFQETLRITLMRSSVINNIFFPCIQKILML